MSIVEKSIRLYAWKSNYQSVQMVQGEMDSRTFRIQLFDTTTPVDLTRCSVKLYAEKPDSTKVYLNCEPVDAANGIVEVVIEEQVVAVPGVVNCWIQVVGTGGTDLRFEGLYLEISECDLDGAVESTSSKDDMRAFLEESARLAEVQNEVRNARMGNATLLGKEQAQDRALADTASAIRREMDANDVDVRNDFANADAVLRAHIDAEKARIDQLTASPEIGEGDLEKEVGDLRVGDDGVTYGSAGTMVRERLSVRNVKATKITELPDVVLPVQEVQQAIEEKGEEVMKSLPEDYTELIEEVDKLSSKIVEMQDELGIKENNALNDVDVVQGWIQPSTGGVLRDSEYYITTDFMQFTTESVYVEIPSGGRFNVCAYDSNKNFIAGGPTQSESMEVTGNRPDRYYRYSFSVNGVTVPSDISKFKILYEAGASLSERVAEIEQSIPTDRGYGGTTQRFTIDVNCFTHDVDSNTTALQDGVSVYADNGFIMLPDSYTDNGTPTRLIVSCHGAGGTVTTNDSQVEQQDTTKYLVANGYAVMDVNGLPQGYATLMGIDIKNNIGSPIAMQSYIKAYHYCMENFNLYPEVFLFGASMGGISSTNLCMSGSIPVIAHGAYCPVLDTYNEIFLKPWSNGLPKTALGIFYGLDTDGNGYVYDEEKVRGYNPVNNKTVTIEGLKYTDYPVPVKFWQCENDNTVPISVTEGFVDAIKRMGRVAHLRKFASGGHEPQQVGTPLTNPSGNTNFRGETVSVYPAVEEVFLWFERYNK